ncbi:MAG TPA: hypothetical protein VG365_16280 [Solirubrobacteraceae bacterium]|jgi:hypothetical protein|nr:hypothetical protein [Solirubrobacteraceae bacterium]
MSALLVLAAETSKVPFYILGGVLALWAVILAGIGLSRPAFPGGEGGARGVIGLTLVIVVLAIGAAVLTS